MRQIFTICFLFLSFTMVAQSNFVEGSITTLNEETIYGKIDYREWNTMPREIRFQRTDSSEKTEIYACKHLASLKIKYNNEEYVRAIVNVNKEPVDKDIMRFESKQEAEASFKLVSDTVFLLTLIRGNVNLFTMTDEQNKQHFFIQKRMGNIDELIYRVVLIPDNQVPTPFLNATSGNSSKAIYFDDYRKQLSEAMQDCPATQKEIDKVYYSYDLLSLVKKYNECVGALNYVKPRDRAKSFFYGYIGVGQPFIDYKNIRSNFDRRFSGTLTSSFGLGFDIGMIRSLNKLSLGLEANFITLQGATTVPSVSSNDQIINNNYTIDIKGVRLNGIFKYVLYNGKIQPYLKAGIGGSSYSKSNLVNTTSLPDQSFFIARYRQDLLKSELHGIIGLGLNVNNFFLESRYESGNDIHRVPGENLKLTRLSLLAGYALPLNKK